MRPRLCVVCHRPASWVVVWSRPAARVGLDGAVSRWTEPQASFACAEHVETVERGQA